MDVIARFYHFSMSFVILSLSKNKMRKDAEK